VGKMVTYFAIVFELREDIPALKNKLRKLLEKNFNKFTSGVRQSEGIKIYMKEGSKLVIE
jgi:Cu/Ag efflux pump CusA